ncbi:hypothetical protein AN6497.2 [Aspergillus nidulans FGSC A4]|uniref:DUF2423 domain-containing protein n=1 Tax=Emericella nidulans (strain FGSC A4 / ATCC 38163 / CBS 112.46 / NRRL 194 / M139) TaxID=227321 RepID=Q5AYY3_EMENI|nr:hypothetical protein [Aspergillus nidulans FGSC A4]EAA57837.1 hypothetical protein AN6497.2 [Aspergillus nidulans FGSC A4]CBF70852.1 TPA: conserved hypothetical protein [Aspergillus nidulans FGSC A4]|eukprot:XP_664101.1 hypothetical protein AN6497.2 [Aspergillus nidulans FGSC A4]
MAKSVRASVQKRNKAKLRSTVFGPAVDARTERLSAKLQELAAQPKPRAQENSNTVTEATNIVTEDESKTNPSENSEAMDIDSSKVSARVRSQRSGRIQKRQRKNRSSIVFKPHPSKTKKMHKKK